jgi:hypothetical protein
MLFSSNTVVPLFHPSSASCTTTHLDPNWKGKPQALLSLRGLKNRDWPDGIVPFSLQRLSLAMYSVSVPLELLESPWVPVRR